MTATLERRARPDVTITSGPPTGEHRREPGNGPLDLAAEVALTVLTLVAAASFGRLFADGSYLVPVVVAAVAAHAVASASRQFRVPAPLAALLAAVSLFAVAVWLVVPETTVAGIPLLGSWDAVWAELTGASGDFRRVVAPAPMTDGFLLATVLGTGIAAHLADWAAFRIGATFESAVPSFTLFLFSAYLGTDANATVALAAYAAALLSYIALHHARSQSRSSTWFASESRRAVPAVLRGASAIGAVAVAAAIFIGPNLPGADEKAVINRDGNRASGSRTTVSPLVDLRGRLVDNTDLEVFTVRTSQRAYWRLTSLDTFDGDIWSSNETYRPTRGSLPDVDADTDGAALVDQEFTISALASIWLPAAYEPERVGGVGGVSYSPESGSLISRSDTSDGLTYNVQSRVPLPSAVELAGAPAAFPRGLGRYLELPDISPRVRQLALREAGRGSPYERALALQRFFRSGAFRYDLRVTQGHSGDALSRFLFETRRGYCEQFAGSYAVMARLVGLPARVAVGFTPGELGDDGRYRVRELNAHAWPEVYLPGSGWLAFEPTPGRGMPGAEGYTGVPEAQADARNPTSATTTPSTTAAPAPEAGATTTTAPPETTTTTGTATDDAAGIPPIVRLGGLVALAAAAYAVAVPALKRRRRSKRRAAATSPTDRVLLAFTEVDEALAQAGHGRRPAETATEFVHRIGRTAPLPAPATAALRDLAGDVAAAAYGAGGSDADAATRAGAVVNTVTVALRARASAGDRLRWALDPRPLLRSGTAETRVTRRRGA